MDMLQMMNDVMGTWGMLAMMLLNFLTGLLLVGILIVGIVAGVQWLRSSKTRKAQSSGEAALDILKKCYARGELTKEEFEGRKRDIA